MSQKNTVLGVPISLEKTAITLMAGNDGIVLNVSAHLVGVTPKYERPTNRSGSGAGLLKVTRSGSWLVRAGTVRENFTI
jgi:hypothetical protein